MAEEKKIRLSHVASKLNVGLSTIVEYLGNKGFKVQNNPNAKITSKQFEILMKEFHSSVLDKQDALDITIDKKHDSNLITDTISQAEERRKYKDEEISIKDVFATRSETSTKESESFKKQDNKLKGKDPDNVEGDVEKIKLEGVKIVGKIDLQKYNKKKPGEKDKPTQQEKAEILPSDTKGVKKDDKDAVESVGSKAEQLQGLTVVGKIDTPQNNKKKKAVASSDKILQNRNKRKRRRVNVEGHHQKLDLKQHFNRDRKSKKGRRSRRKEKLQVSNKEVQEQIKTTLAKLSSGGKDSKITGAKYRRKKRLAVTSEQEKNLIKEEQEAKIIKVTEYISTNDLASILDVSVNEVISVCIDLGMFVSINQRLDAEAITVITDEFGYDVEFTTIEQEEIVNVLEEDKEEDLLERAPIVTIMGHVDHGKTSLLDYIRKTKVIEKEAGGITQHIGAYEVTTDSGSMITFLDTPGHEAFTAMRARGAKLTDIVIIVVAADDGVKPQTKEAINHALLAEVPVIIAINKIDKPGANPEKVKEELSKKNILVEDWGGKYQCQEISAKKGTGIPELLEKVLLEAELLELKANANKDASGIVVEATLDKGRGYLTSVLVQTGTIKVGDIILAGSYYGRVKDMTNHNGKKTNQAGPSMPVQILGLNAAPQAGDNFHVMKSEKEVREIAAKREQIHREQKFRTKKHITLDEIGRRLAIGNFQELNLIVKGDVDGSVEALTDSLLELAIEEIDVNVIHKGVGQISESDVILAAAADALIIGFQVRPSPGARKLAEKEEIEIRLYSVIYHAIEEVKDAIEGMLIPAVEEAISGTAEVREVFKINKVGTIAGCYVTDGTISKNVDIRLIRNGIVAYSGQIDALKRFKDDISSVKTGYECGISIKDFNDIKVGDLIEGFEEREVKR
ncbi:MAG: translation initiation factor IF-2 [Cytophagales bacterium]|nr:translation initiation factor IF-2 [Cytophagales bacterium]